MSTSPMIIEGVFKSLDQWREERGLQHTVGNIAANIGEEIVEYLRAENDYQRVDALCDIYVFSVNAIHAIGRMPDKSVMIQCSDDYLPSINTYMSYIAEHFSIVVSATTFHNDPTYSLVNLARDAKYQMQAMGFDFLIAMDETLKEIHSRTGAWNEETQKWEKFKTPEAKALWYSADYSKAKTKEHQHCQRSSFFDAQYQQKTN